MSCASNPDALIDYTIPLLLPLHGLNERCVCASSLAGSLLCRLCIDCPAPWLVPVEAGVLILDLDGAKTKNE